MDLKFYLIFLLGFLPDFISSKRLRGSLSSVTQDWKFMTRFCFISEKGKFQYYFEYPEEYADQDLLLYYDDIWLPVYLDEKANCSAKKGTLSRHLGQIITLSPAYTTKCDNFKKPDGSNWINCSDSRYFRTARERWWFFVLSSCGNKKGLNLTYSLQMTNGDTIWEREFSADEIWILPIVMSFFLFMLMLSCLSVYVGVKLSSRQLFHSTYKLYIVSVIFYTFHLLIQTIAHGKYANDGSFNSFHGTKVFGRILEAVAKLIFLLKLILMAKGFTITRGRLSRNGSVKIGIFMTLYTLLYAVMFVWEAEFFDEGRVLYFYESIPGYCMIGLRILGWLWFLFAIIITLKHYPERKKFYIPYALLYTIWFWAVPVTVLIAVTVIAKHMREKIVIGIECGTAVFGYLFFLIFTWPSVANKHFPFSVRTSQIDVVTNAPHVKEEDMGFPSEDTLRPEGNDCYTLTESERTAGPNFVDIFLVSNTRSAPDKFLEGRQRNGKLPPLERPSASAPTENLLNLPD